MPANHEIHLTGADLTLGLVSLGLLALVAVSLRREGHQAPALGGHSHGADQDWSVPRLDAYADGQSFFHCWDPRFKVASLFLFCFLVVSLKTLAAGGLALLVAWVAVAACRIPFNRAVTRLVAMAGFLTMFLIVVPFTSPLRPGETLIYLPWPTGYPFHAAGFRLALTIVFKACAIALLMEPLLGTAPLAVTLHALTQLGLPAALGQMLLLSHRYIFVFLHEISRMYRGMRVRGFVPATDIDTMRTMGNFFGMLFVRSFERTQRVYEAMLSRGYDGRFPTFVRFTASGWDWAKAGLWLLIGLGLVLADRHFG